MLGIAVWFTDVGPGIAVWFHPTTLMTGSIPTCSLFQCFVYQRAASLHAACFSALYVSEQHPYITFFLPSPAWAEGIVLGLCVCVCVLPQNCCLSSIISKSKQAASHKLGNLRQIVVLYKTGKFLQASVVQIA